MNSATHRPRPRPLRAGWAHVGVIDAEAGIEPDIVCGRLNELRQSAEAATWREVIGLLDVRLAGGGLISGIQLGLVLSKLGRGELELRRLQYSKPHRRGNRPTTGRRGGSITLRTWLSLIASARTPDRKASAKSTECHRVCAARSREFCKLLPVMLPDRRLGLFALARLPPSKSLI